MAENKPETENMDVESVQESAANPTVEERTALTKRESETPVAGQGIWAGGTALENAMRMAKILSMAPMVPQNYRGQPGNCLIALDMAQRMNMPPMMIMQNLYIVSGNPAWSGQACVALVNNSGRFAPLKFHESYDSETGDFSCTAYAKELKTGETVYGVTVDRQMTKDCGWLDKPGSYWKKMPMQMARYRSAAFFARAYCPEALMGLYTSDEMMDIKGCPPEKKEEDA